MGIKKMSETTLSEALEHRNYERFSARYPAKFKDTRDDFGMNVFLQNASAEGVQIACRQQLFIHDHVTLEVELPDNHPPMEIRGEVIWVRNSQPNIWEIGLHLPKVDLLRMSRLYKFTLE